MLYLVAHSFLNGQSKNSNLFPLPELHETQFKKTVELWGREWGRCCYSATLYCDAFTHEAKRKRMNSPLLIALLLLSFLRNYTVEKADVVDSICDGHFNGTNRGNDSIAVNTHLTSISSVLNVTFQPHRLQYTGKLSGLVGRRIVRLPGVSNRWN